MIEAGRRISSVVASGLHWTRGITPSTDARLCAARLPGDEFALMVAGVDGRDANEMLVRAVLTQLRRPCRIEGIDCFLTASAGLGLDCVAVNMPTQHFERESLLDTMRTVLARNRLAAGAIELELTETAMVRDFERTLPRMHALITAGVRLAIDDFGTGYSSLAYLTRLPIAKLKVDRAFVSQLGISREGEAVCRAIVALGRSLGVQVLAEGVETVEQMRALHALDCVTLQGFLFAKPIPADQVPAVITSAEARARAEVSRIATTRRAPSSGVRSVSASKTAMEALHRANMTSSAGRGNGADRG